MEAAGEDRSAMEENEDSEMVIDWDSSGLYILQSNEVDCSRETSARAAAKRHTWACAEHSPQLRLASSAKGPFKHHKCDMMHD